jgi:hypothetical protein
MARNTLCPMCPLRLSLPTHLRRSRYGSKKRKIAGVRKNIGQGREGTPVFFEGESKKFSPGDMEGAAERFFLPRGVRWTDGEYLPAEGFFQWAYRLHPWWRFRKAVRMPHTFWRRSLKIYYYRYLARIMPLEANST